MEETPTLDTDLPPEQQEKCAEEVAPLDLQSTPTTHGPPDDEGPPFKKPRTAEFEPESEEVAPGLDLPEGDEMEAVSSSSLFDNLGEAGTGFSQSQADAAAEQSQGLPRGDTLEDMMELGGEDTERDDATSGNDALASAPNEVIDKASLSPCAPEHEPTEESAAAFAVRKLLLMKRKASLQTSTETADMDKPHGVEPSAGLESRIDADHRQDDSDSCEVVDEAEEVPLHERMEKAEQAALERLQADAAEGSCADTGQNARTFIGDAEQPSNVKNFVSDVFNEAEGDLHDDGHPPQASCEAVLASGRTPSASSAQERLPPEPPVIAKAPAPVDRKTHSRIWEKTFEQVETSLLRDIFRAHNSSKVVMVEGIVRENWKRRDHVHFVNAMLRTYVVRDPKLWGCFNPSLPRPAEAKLAEQEAKYTELMRGLYRKFLRTEEHFTITAPPLSRDDKDTQVELGRRFWLQFVRLVDLIVDHRTKQRPRSLD